MAFDEGLASRARLDLAGIDDVIEKKMFGGLAFLVQGHMSVGVRGSDLIVRIDPRETDEALKEPGTRIFDITGRPMKGWILVAASALNHGSALSKWVGRGLAYAQSLPPK